MDFTTMHRKLEEGSYSTYEDMQEDLELMFTNCMKYNAPDTKYHKQVSILHSFVGQQWVSLCLSKQAR